MDELRDLYQQVILDHNKNPRNYHKLEKANRMAEGNNPLCGDQFTVYLLLEDDTIKDIGFEGAGCAISKASASIMSSILKGKSKVMTHSYSSTVLDVLGSCTDIEVICPESRPLCEGLRTAQVLGERGIRVKIMVDSAAPSLMGECDVVMVGADAITPEGVVNKIGTYALALAAREQKIPFYVLAGTEKFLPPPFAQALRIEERDPKEVTQEAIPRSRVENRYFDITPLELITGVVAQDGVIPGEEVQKHLVGMTISRRLQKP